MRFISIIEDESVAQRILRHLEVPGPVAAGRGGRAGGQGRPLARLRRGVITCGRALEEGGAVRIAAELRLGRQERAAEWLMENYDKVYGQGGESIWLLPNVNFDSTKDPGLLPCAAKHSRVSEARKTCIELERCSAICQVKPTSQSGAIDEASCKAKCRSWFPKCKAAVGYAY